MAPKNQLVAKIQTMALHRRETTVDIEIKELESRRSTLQRKKRNLYTAFEKAYNDYSRMWNSKFATKIFEILARELRDMVYCHLIGGAPTAHILPRYKSLPANSRGECFFHVELGGRRGQARGLDNELQHYFIGDYMGNEFAMEIAQVFNRCACYNVRHIDDVVPLLYSGPLIIHPSCRPLDHLRTLSVCVSMEPYFSSNNYHQAVILQRKAESKATKDDYEKQVSWLSDLAATEHASRLAITLSVEVRTSFAMERYKAVLFPHIQELVKKKCKVFVSWWNMDRSSWRYEEITYDRTKLLSTNQ
ncbi:hypothetical protein CUC08_Gglean004655 [Alternaria sp. MG1]|nr:hypothetical protein CUC08_Gglean004655 [Alternaria sp. MG1]